MSRVCELTGIGPMSGNNVSHSNRKTRTRWLPNLKKKKYHVTELEQTYTFTLSTRAIRSIDKIGGLIPAVLKVNEHGLSPRMAKLKRSVQKKRRQLAAASKA